MGDYLWYLQHFEQFHQIPFALKEKQLKKYKRYVRHLLAYLETFFQMVQPLTDYQVVTDQFDKDFSFRWQEGTIRGWERYASQERTSRDNKMHCSACMRLFENVNTYANHFSGSRHKKMEKIKLKAESNTTPTPQTNLEMKELCKQEEKVVRLKELLADLVHDSQNQVRRKQTMNVGEMEAENF